MSRRFFAAGACMLVATGLVHLLLLRHAGRAPGLLRQSAIVYAGFYGVMTGMALRYWFPAPILFVALTFLCFVAALATAERG
jgi:uncharacterized membrane protein YhhN